MPRARRRKEQLRIGSHPFKVARRRPDNRHRPGVLVIAVSVRVHGAKARRGYRISSGCRYIDRGRVRRLGPIGGHIPLTIELQFTRDIDHSRKVEAPESELPVPLKGHAPDSVLTAQALGCTLPPPL